MSQKPPFFYVNQIKAYCEKNQYLINKRSPTYKDTINHFTDVIFSELSIESRNVKTIASLLEKKGKNINDAIDKRLLKSNQVIDLLRRNYPFIQAIVKRNELRYPMGIDWSDCANRLEKASKTFNYERRFRPYLAGIVINLLKTAPKMTYRRTTHKGEISDFQKYAKCFNEVEWHFLMEGLHQKYVQEYNTLSWLSSKKTKNRFRFFLMIVFDFLPENNALLGKDKVAIIQKIKDDLKSFSAQKDSQKYIFLKKYQEWYEGISKSEETIRKFFQKNINKLVERILEDEILLQTKKRIKAQEVIKEIIEWHKNNEKG